MRIFHSNCNHCKPSSSFAAWTDNCLLFFVFCFPFQLFSISIQINFNFYLSKRKLAFTWSIRVDWIFVTSGRNETRVFVAILPAKYIHTSSCTRAHTHVDCNYWHDSMRNWLDGQEFPLLYKNPWNSNGCAIALSAHVFSAFLRLRSSPTVPRSACARYLHGTIWTCD